MIKRTPNDPAWYRGGLWHESMPIDIPGLWYMSWYDVSVGPNLAMYNHVRKTAKGAAANQQRLAPGAVPCCQAEGVGEHQPEHAEHYAISFTVVSLKAVVGVAHAVHG